MMTSKLFLVFFLERQIIESFSYFQIKITWVWPRPTSQQATQYLSKETHRVARSSFCQGA